MRTRYSDWSVHYSARGIPSYSLELWHDGLRKHRVIKGTDKQVVSRKAEIQAAEWEDRWAQIEEREAERLERDQRRLDAEQRTEEAHDLMETLRGLLHATLAVDDTIDWADLKDTSVFSEPIPQPPPSPLAPSREREPSEPHASDYTPALTLFDKIVRSRRERKTAEADERHRAARQRWQESVQSVRERNDKNTKEHQNAVRLAAERHQAAIGEWEKRRLEFEALQIERNNSIDRQRESYIAGDPLAIRDYCDMVLSGSEYPEFFPKEFDIEYMPETRTAIVEYSLPSLEHIPTLIEVKYVQSKDDFTEKHLSGRDLARLYDDVIYQTTLRTVHELFEADSILAIDSVAFNGFVDSIDKRTGKPINACIVSLHVRRDEFIAIDLRLVDPKACFKSLKGVGSSQLHSLTPVAPLLQLRREDGRFVSAREIAETLDESTNLAAIPWEDFEHLIRELFEAEFASSGGEVKVTQASRDGGVDAVAFDPDPIRGGKIIIQAKRYTNTVGVAAVRDLYGAVHNEGANKGILVTTSDYGPDAYNFVRDKPLTLLNGANLLHMLEKHGRKAKIDLAAARLLFKDPMQ